MTSLQALIGAIVLLVVLPIAAWIDPEHSTIFITNGIVLLLVLVGIIKANARAIGQQTAELKASQASTVNTATNAVVTAVAKQGGEVKEELRIADHQKIEKLENLQDTLGRVDEQTNGKLSERFDKIEAKIEQLQRHIVKEVAEVVINPATKST